MNTFAERLRGARLEAGLSQAALATKAGVSQGTIGNIESGARQRPRELLAIAAACGVRAEWLETGVGPKHPTAVPLVGSARASAAPSDLGVAHEARLDEFTVVGMTWDDVKTATELPPRFTVDMPDDALVPSVMRGAGLVFEPAGVGGPLPAPETGILVQDAGGRRYIRRFAEAPGGSWVAQALNPAYATLDAGRDGLVIVAVMVARMGGRV